MGYVETNVGECSKDIGQHSEDCANGAEIGWVVHTDLSTLATDDSR